MSREVDTPEGHPWVVEIDWVARRIRNPWRATVRSIGDRWSARRARRLVREVVAGIDAGAVPEAHGPVCVVSAAE